jgi:hypothetical protein
MRWHLALAAALISVWAITAHAASTIQPNLLPLGIPANAGLINQNFGNAINDVNALQTQNAGVTAPSNPSAGNLWLSIPQNSTTFTLNEWDGKSWVPIGSFDSVNHIWMPPIGGGVPPTILSATTTDLGSVPQATVSISGVNAIQSFGTSAPAGTIKVVLFTAATPLINSASLVLPGNTNITQTAGGVEVALAQGGGAWKVIFDSQSVLVGTGVNGVFVCPSITVANGLISSAAGAACPVNVATNAALQAITAPAAGTEVFRAGFYAAGDGGKANYTFSTSACSLNAGAGDNGSQVAPTAGSGCWLVQVPPTGLSFKVWGAKMDGSTNDAAADQAALNWAGQVPGGTLQVPAGGLSYTGSAQITDNGLPVIIHGNNPTNGNDNGACTSGFTDVAGGIGANINILSLTGTGSKIDHVCILAGSASTPATSGVALTVGAATGQSVSQQAADFNVIKFPFIGFIGGGQTGIGYGTCDISHSCGDTNSLHVTNNWVVSPAPGGSGYQIGPLSTNATTTSVLFENNRTTCVAASPATFGVAFFDAAIDTYSGNEMNNCNYGTAVVPGAYTGHGGQVVLGEGLTNVIGDSSQINNLLINATAAQAHIVYLTFVGWWAAMNTGETGPSVLIENTGSGLVQNIALTGGVAHGANNVAGPQNVIEIDNCVNGVTITGNIIAADGAGGGTESTGIYDNDACFGVTITGNNFVQNLGTLAIGLHISSIAGNERTVVGNNFHTATVPMQVDQTAVNFTLTEANNSPLSTNSVNITPSGSFEAPMLDQFAITGAGPVNNMSGWWQIRQLRMRVNSSGFAFQNGGGTGGFCENLTTTTSPQMVMAWWNPNLACWDLK